MSKRDVQLGDCLEILKKYPDCYFDLIYLDPPFFTQKNQQLRDKHGKKYLYSDIWGDHSEYAAFMGERLKELKRVLALSGSIFVHCDRNAVHIIRGLLDQIFGSQNFQSDIIWYYKRWSNSKKGLLPQHQNILFYSKTKNFKFNQIYMDYSPTTNIDQILQKRERNEIGKTIYMKDQEGNIIQSDEKQGVPLGDVWEIPYLNPKAKERTGYPTQKPLLLLERILQLCSDTGDKVLDPFCGSGTTLVAASLMKRAYTGIDISEDAVKLSKYRLANPIKTDSRLLKEGKEAYLNQDQQLSQMLVGLEFTPVQRNKGIDAILKQKINGKMVFIRIQKANESIDDAVRAIKNATIDKGNAICIVVSTLFQKTQIRKDQSCYIIDSTSSFIYKLLDKLPSIKASNKVITAAKKG